MLQCNGPETRASMHHVGKKLLIILVMTLNVNNIDSQ